MLAMTSRLAALASIALISGCAYMPWSKPEPVETGFVTHTFDSQLTGKPRDYGVVVPKEYNNSRRAWPVIFFLHGAGERGDDINLVLKHGPLKEALQRSDFPFIAVGPQCPRPAQGQPSLSMRWDQSEQDLLTILEDVKSKYRVDETRIYLTGLSLGGYGSFLMAAKHPDLWAAVAPICGGGDPSLAKAYLGKPFWVFHGEKDRVVPVARSREMVESMKSMGHDDVKLTIYPEADHDSWTETYQNDELYAWFLSHRLEPKK